MGLVVFELIKNEYKTPPYYALEKAEIPTTSKQLSDVNEAVYTGYKRVR